MKRLFACLVLSLVVTSQLSPVGIVQAAASIRIFEGLTGDKGVSSFTIPSSAEKSSWPVYIALSEAPPQPTEVKVSHEGAAVFYWSGSDNLKFDQTNWSQRRQLAFEYQATAKPGTRGRITLSGEGLPSREILFTIEGQAANGSEGTNSGSSTSSTDPAENSGSGVNSDPAAANFDLKELNKVKGFSGLGYNELFTRLIGWFLTIIALAAFFSIIYSGFLYITAGGGADQTTKAKRNITWALTSLIITVFAYALLRFVAGII